ncbi:unnamed protein product [Acanthoscelides obtectus]|nr:unnamed protein product [Acanthoscelides obtectus]CAK1647721.1 hypothetical protein AOBTE_LOCUS15366 [Acanthoscelides obtectus]
MRLINVNPKVKEVLRQVFDDEAKMKLCKSEMDLNTSINIFEREDERPLLSYELERRKSSVKTAYSNQERKMSIYDIE